MLSLPSSSICSTSLTRSLHIFRSFPPEVAVLSWDVPRHWSPGVRDALGGLRDPTLLAARSHGDPGAAGRLRGNRKVKG